MGKGLAYKFESGEEKNIFYLLTLQIVLALSCHNSHIQHFLQQYFNTFKYTFKYQIYCTHLAEVPGFKI